MGRQLFSVTKNNVKNFLVALFLLAFFVIFIFNIGLVNHFYLNQGNQKITLIFFGLNNHYSEKPALNQIWIGDKFFEQQTTTSHIYSAILIILGLLIINFFATFAVLFAPTNYGVISFIVDFFSKIALILILVLTIMILVQFHRFTIYYANKIKDVKTARVSVTTMALLISFGIILPALNIVINLNKRIIW